MFTVESSLLAGARWTDSSWHYLGVIAELLRPPVRAVEAFEDPTDTALYAEEEVAVANAVEKRRREFATGRECARQALKALGHPPTPIPVGSHGEPLWPSGIVGSITHCAGYRACAVAKVNDFIAIGIDAEPHQPLPDGVLAAIATPEELPLVRDLEIRAPTVRWDRVLFSAKESVYKAWASLYGRSLDFEDALVRVDPDGSFCAHLMITRPPQAPGEFVPLSGQWLARDGLVLTAITLRDHREATPDSPGAETR